MFNVISGINVVVSSYMATFTDVPARKHKGGCKTSYSKRIQKKWNKRFGISYERNFLTNGSQVVCNQENFEFLRSELADKGE